MSHLTPASRLQHGDPCNMCGGTWRKIGAGLLECDGWCGQTLRTGLP